MQKLRANIATSDTAWGISTGSKSGG